MDHLKRDRRHAGPGELHPFLAPESSFLPFVSLSQEFATTRFAEPLIATQIQNAIDCGVLPTLVAKVDQSLARFQ